jgi:hypothetical protein
MVSHLGLKIQAAKEIFFEFRLLDLLIALSGYEVLVFPNSRKKEREESSNGDKNSVQLSLDLVLSSSTSYSTKPCFDNAEKALLE